MIIIKNNNTGNNNKNNNKVNNNYTSPVWKLGVYLDQLKLENSYCPGFPIFAQ
jgi:hypothetical protein